MVEEGGRPPGQLSALSKLGLRPLRTEPARVNWETARTSPPASARPRFILPAASGKIRSSTALRARASACSGRVALFDADEEAEAAADRSDGPPVDLDLRLAHPLKTIFIDLVASIDMIMGDSQKLCRRRDCPTANIGRGAPLRGEP